MDFILSVFGANVVICLGVLAYLIGIVFTMKNVYDAEYDSIKAVGFKTEDSWDVGVRTGDSWGAKAVYDSDKVGFLIFSFFFPVVWIWIICCFFWSVLMKTLALTFTKGFVALDKVIPRLTFKREDNDG